MLESFSEVKNSLGNIDWKSSTNKQNIIELVKKCWQQARIKTRKVNLCLKEKYVFSQVVNFPHIPSKELENAIQYEAEQFIPIPLKDVQIEYQILREPPKGSVVEKMEVLVIAAQKEAIANLIDTVTKAGLKPINIETEVLAISRIFGQDLNGTNLIVAIGQDSCHALLMDRGQIKLIYSLGVSGGALTRAVANQLSMDVIQAEQYKIAYGVDQNIMNGKIADILRPIIDTFANELQKMIDYTTKHLPQIHIKRIILCGGTAEMKGLSAYLAKKFNLEITSADPFSMFDKKINFPKELSGHTASYTTAVGLAIKTI